MSDGSHGFYNELGSPEIPGTPTEKRRSRYDQFVSPSQSPMIKISEEENMYGNTTPSLADLQPPPLSKRFSGHFGSPTLRPSSLYSLDNNSSSSLVIPGGNLPGNRSSITSLKYVPPPSIPIRGKSPTRTKSPSRGPSPIRNRSRSPKKFTPFDFKSTTLNGVPPLQSSRAAHRKGHRYKHSSVSMNFFQEPKQRAPLKIPASFPIPTYREFLSSCSPDQKLKLSWSIFHLLFSLATFLIGFLYSLHSISTLSHLMFYDSLACLTVVFVNIMGNFDVWSKSSIKYPFGLGRIEVLFGFALSISLIFVGCDLVSHFLEEFMISFFDTDATNTHIAGHNHNDHSDSATKISVALYEFILLATGITTLISSRITSDHKVSATLLPSLSALRKTVITNPTHIITLLFTSYLALEPLILSLNSEFDISEISTLVIALLICYMGWKVVKYLGHIVLLSFPSIGTDSRVLLKLKESIQAADSFKSTYKITNLIVSQVHMNLVLVLVHIKMVGGSDDDETNIRSKVNEIARNVLNSDNIETTVDIDRL